ncbi:FHA domain-containing protein [Thermodesulfobacteriota bacterium]
MSKDSEKTIRVDSTDPDTPEKEKSGFSSTLELSQKTFIGKISTSQHAFLEVLGKKGKKIILGEEEVIIGRIPDCDIQLLVENVSREHARIIYRNEEYQIEDLGSTNGIYLNGIKVQKCILRDNDLIEIGGVKIQFGEEKIIQTS